MNLHDTTPSRRKLLGGCAIAGTFFIFPPGAVACIIDGG